ncbi:MAG: hypothetical protein DI535_19885 [Citrobacter freundii]|nr:MAG: hypothetical protein DI535_19885 [Citrobacter freundii]
MKKEIISCGLMFYSLICNGETLRWDGEAGDGQWVNELNWSIDRVPGPADEVVLDNTFITGDYTVTLPSGNTLVSIVSLIIEPVSSIIQCILPASNIASPALLLSGAGDVFILHSGAVFRNASGATAGTPVTVTANGSFRINNGGHYIHQTARGHTDFLVSRLSTADGTEKGVFEFDVPGTASYTVSVSGRVFGRLVFSAASSGASRTYTGAGINPVLIRGGLVIGTNAIFSYGANTDTITVQGNSVIEAGGVLNIANGSNSSTIRFKGDLDNRGLVTETGSSTSSSIIMNGDAAQSIACPGNISQQVTMIMDNDAGLMLATPLHLSHHLQFRKGRIYSTTANMLTLGAAASCSGGSESGFVQGPIKKTGSAAFTFPVGTGGIYAPLTIGAGGLDSDEFIVEYKRANPQSTPGLGNMYQFPINHISYVEYWNVTRNNGGSPRQLGLSVSPYSFVYDLQALVVARSENGQWVSEGGVDHIPGLPQSPYVTGSFLSVGAVESFGSFTVGSLINQAQNPLPLPLEYFTARLIDGRVQLNWRSGICPMEKLRSELSFSESNRVFTELFFSRENDTICAQAFTHTPVNKGQHYYRLKLKDEFGEIIISKEIPVMIEENRSKPLYYLNGIHTGNNGIELIAKLPKGNSLFYIFDAGGGIVYLKERYTNGEEERINLPVFNLTKGVYRLIVTAGKERLNAGFVK